MSSKEGEWMRGRVKAVPSGDSLVIVGNAAKGMAPPEKTITLSSVMAPRLARRGTIDDSFAWESREFLRKLAIGKEAVFRIDYSVPTIGREFGTVFIGDKNVAFLVVEAGWGKVKEQREKKGEQGQNKVVEVNPFLPDLQRLEKLAEQKGVGHWTKTLGSSEASIRNLPPSAIGDSSTFDAISFLEANKGKPLEAVVEFVRDGSTIRAYLLPEFQFVQVYLAGIKAPSMGRRIPQETGNDTGFVETNGEASGKPRVTSAAQRVAAAANASEEHLAEPFAMEARHFTETRVLNRDVRIVLEGVDKFKNLIGSVYYPDGESAKDLSLQLLQNGLAKYVDWSANMMEADAKKRLKSAELEAKTSRIKQWINYQVPASNSTGIHNQNFTGKVIEVVSGDCIIVADDSVPSGSSLALRERRINLSSVRCPKMIIPPRENKKETPGTPRKKASKKDPSGNTPKKDGKMEQLGNTFNKDSKMDPSGNPPSKETKAEEEKRAKVEAEAKAKAKSELLSRYAREAKEFMRSRLIGRQVSVSMEYSRKVTARLGEDGESRNLNFGSVFLESPVKLGSDNTSASTSGNSQRINVAELLVGCGFADVIRHRDFEERSNHYDALLSAEARAISGKKGKHSDKENVAPLHINDLTTDSAKARIKEHLQPFLREKKIHAVVEYVFSGHRFKLLVPSQTCTFFFSFSGVRCPGRGEPISDEAITFMRRRIMQRDVEIDVDTVDRNGTFLGSLWESKTNMAVALLEAGLARYQGFEDAPDGRFLMQAEQSAKNKKLKIWENYVEGQEVAASKRSGSSSDKKYQKEEHKVIVTEVMGGGKLYYQRFADPEVATIQKQLSSLTIPETPVGFQPRKGFLVLAQFSADKSWNRAMIVSLPKEKVESAPKDQGESEKKEKVKQPPKERIYSANELFEVFYIDYGNQETVTYSQIRPLDPTLEADAGLAQLCSLAYIKVPSLEEDYGEEAAFFLSDLTLNGPKELKAIIEEKDTTRGKVKGQGTGTIFAVTLIDTSNDSSINATMLKEGLAKIEKKRGNSYRKAAITELEKLQNEAKKNRINIWEYGDVQSDDEDRGPPMRKAGGKR